MEPETTTNHTTDSTPPNNKSYHAYTKTLLIALACCLGAITVLLYQKKNNNIKIKHEISILEQTKNKLSSINEEFQNKNKELISANHSLQAQKNNINQTILEITESLRVKTKESSAYLEELIQKNKLNKQNHEDMIKEFIAQETKVRESIENLNEQKRILEESSTKTLTELGTERAAKLKEILNLRDENNYVARAKRLSEGERNKFFEEVQKLKTISVGLENENKELIERNNKIREENKELNEKQTKVN